MNWVGHEWLPLNTSLLRSQGGSCTRALFPSRVTYFTTCFFSCPLFWAFFFHAVVSMEMSWVWVVCCNPHDYSTVTLYCLACAKFVLKSCFGKEAEGVWRSEPRASGCQLQKLQPKPYAESTGAEKLKPKSNPSQCCWAGLGTSGHHGSGRGEETGVLTPGRAFLLFVSATFCRTVDAETLEEAVAAFLSL